MITLELVLAGHPDRICDHVADYILDRLVVQDPKTRAGIECLIKNEVLIVAGEVTTSASDLNYGTWVEECFQALGTEHPAFSLIMLSQQSSDIAKGVDNGGAGDQGIVYGYACNDNDRYLPNEMLVMMKFKKTFEQMIIINREIFGTDGKFQITFDKNRIDTFIINIQTNEGVPREVYESLIKDCISSDVLDDAKIFINPTGDFVVGGSYADCGLTGRKLQCDSYMGLVRHGGGAWCGKDMTKVDRSGSYYARSIAKHIIKSGLARRCLVSISFGIGINDAIMVEVDTFRTGRYKNSVISKAVRKVFDFNVAHFVNLYKNSLSSYYETVSLSHFEPNMAWEIVDNIMADKLRYEAARISSKKNQTVYDKYCIGCIKEKICHEEDNICDKLLELGYIHVGETLKDG